MAKANKLVKKTLFYMIGTAASSIIGAALIPIYAIFVSSPSLGAYDYAATWANVLAPICYLAIWESILRFALQVNEEKRARIEATAVRFALGATGVAVLVLLAVLLLFPESWRLTLACGLMAISNGLAQTFQYTARCKQETKLYVSSGIASSFVNIGIILVLVCALRVEYWGLAGAYVLSQLAICFLIDRRLHLLRLGLNSKLNRPLIMECLRYSTPLIFNLVVGILLSGFGRMLIVWQLGDAANGQYAFAMKFGSLVSALGGAFSMASIEEAILRTDSAVLSDYFASIIDGLWTLMLSVAIIVMPAVRLFYLFVVDAQYEESFPMVPIFIMYAIFGIMSTNYGNTFQVRLKTQYAVYTTLAGLVVTVVGSVLLINVWGTVGVAVAAMLGMGTVMAARWVSGKRLVPFTTSKFPLLLLAVFVAVSVVLVADIVNRPWGLLAMFAALCLLFFKPALDGYRRLKNIRDVA